MVICYLVTILSAKKKQIQKRKKGPTIYQKRRKSTVAHNEIEIHTSSEVMFSCLIWFYICLHVFSCCYFNDTSSTLDDAEKAMLETYCDRSGLEDGHTVLDVGCGWGSLSIYIAKKYSNCKITGICNSNTQKAFIEERCRYVAW